MAPSFMAMLILFLWQTLGHPHLFDEAVEFNVGQGFYKVVYNHLIGWDVLKFDPLWTYFITDVIVLDINMICSWIED